MRVSLPISVAVALVVTGQSFSQTLAAPRPEQSLETKAGSLAFSPDGSTIATSQDKKDPKPKVEQVIGIWTPPYQSWLLIHSDGSGRLGYGAGGTPDTNRGIPAGTFDVAQVTKDLRGLKADIKDWQKARYGFTFTSERKGPEQPGPTYYTQDRKVIPALFEKAANASAGPFQGIQPAAAQSAPRQSRYIAYWLTKTDGKSEYRKVLITRMPLPELAKLMKLHAELGNVLKDAPAPQLLERPALTIITYKKDSIWNDGVPLKPVTRFKDLNEKERTLEVNGVRHHYEECPLADVVCLLKAPEGKEPISRIRAPLEGMEQTARALRLLLDEQIKDDESKRK